MDDLSWSLLESGAGTGRDDAEDLLPRLYAELREQARRLLGRERSGHTLQATALVHEAWLRLAEAADFRPDGEDERRRRFIAYATTAMRRILVDHARGRAADRRGGDWRRVTIDGDQLGLSSGGHDVVELHDALEVLAADRPRMARMAELRLFGGLSTVEAGTVLGLKASAAKDEWKLTRAFLARELRDLHAGDA